MDYSDKPNQQSMALDATVLANERTFQSWIRTGLAALASGLGIAKFFSESMPLWMLLTIASVMIALSIGAFMLASWRYNNLHFKMKDLDVDATPAWVVRIISFTLVGCSLLAFGGILAAALG